MHFPAVVAAAFAGSAAAFPADLTPRAKVPTENGFPNPNPQQLKAIESLAQGTLPNTALPAKLEPSSLTAFQLIAFNEFFETAFFASLLNNITNDVPGYQVSSQAQTEALDTVKTVLEQEKLHALSAVKTLQHFKSFVPSPCQYKFPTTNFVDAILLAETFTSLVLGTLQDVAQLFAKNGDIGPVRTIASIIGQEGEQNGFYRVTSRHIISEKPFLTTSVASYAYSALQSFVVPNSCPFPLSKIGVPIFPPLTVAPGNGVRSVEPQQQNIAFSADLSSVKAAEKYYNGNGNGLFVTYLNGQNLPVSVPLTDVHWSGKVVKFNATFPYDTHQLDGLSIASLTTKSNISDPDDLPAYTLAAPAFIQAIRYLHWSLAPA